MAGSYRNDNLAYDQNGSTDQEEKKLNHNLDQMEEIDLNFPKKKLARLSKIEKFIYSLIILIAVGFTFAIIYSVTQVQKINNENSLIKMENDHLNESVIESQQKVDEMMQGDRIKAIAKKKGLSPIDGNLKKIDWKDQKKK